MHPISSKDLPIVSYTKQEHETWRSVYSTLSRLQTEYACLEYLDILKQMQNESIMTSNTIPQVILS
jgi:phenylalanine-4-hydroxylase